MTFFRGGILCLLLTTPASLLAAGHAPQLVCKQPTYSFGEHESSGDIEHTFKIRNAGDLTLQIFNLRPSCGCMIPQSTQRLVPPGGEASITMRFVLRGRQGPQDKFVYIESNDPVQPSFALRMEGQIVDPVEIDPKLLFFGRIPAQTTLTGTLMVAAAGTNVLGNVTAQVDSPAFMVSSEPVISNKTARIVVNSKPPLPEGLTRATLRISTGNPRMPVLTTVISVFVPGAFSIVPPELLLVGHEGDQVRRDILVRSESNQAFRVLAVEPPLKDISSTITPTNPAAYRIVFPNLPVIRELEGQNVRIVTDHPARPEILIPIRVFLR